MNKKINSLFSVTAATGAGTVLVFASLILPGCDFVRSFGLNPQSFATGGALVVAGMAVTQNYGAGGSANNPTDPVNPEFGGATSATTEGANSVSVSWDAATDIGPAGPITYRIFYTSQSTDEATIIAGGTQTTIADATSIMVTGLDPGTTYNFVVRAEDSVGNTDGNTQKFSALTNLSFGGVTSVDSRTSDTIRVNWTAAESASSASGDITYTAYASSTTDDAATIVSSPSNTVVSAAGATSVDLTGLTSNTLYNVVVRATTSDNDEGTTSANTATRSARTRLSFDGIATLTALASDTLQATWSAPPNLTSEQTVTYTIYVSSDPAVDTPEDLIRFGTQVTAEGTSVTSPAILSPDTLYRLLVRATTENPANDEENTMVRSVRTWLTFSGATSAQNVTRAATLRPDIDLVSSDELDIGWTAATEVSSETTTVTYNVYRSTSSSIADILASTPTTTTATTLRVTGLSAGTAYKFIVRAISSADDAVEDGNTATQPAITAPSVSGTVTQTEGSTVGNLRVATIRDSDGATLEDQIAAGDGVTSGTYALLHVRQSGVADAAQTFRIGAFRDLNGNGMPDEGEPTSVSGTFTMGTTNRTGEDI